MARFGVATVGLIVLLGGPLTPGPSSQGGASQPLILAASPQAGDQAGVDFFERKIRPVLVEHCYSCHSTEAKKQRGGLLLDTKEAVLAGGDTGPALVPG